MLSFALFAEATQNERLTTELRPLTKVDELQQKIGLVSVSLKHSDTGKQREQYVREVLPAPALSLVVACFKSLGEPGERRKKLAEELTALLRHGLEFQPSEFWLHWLLARFAPEGLHHYRAALAVRPNSALAQRDLGEALLVAQDALEAEKCFRKLVALDTNNPSSHDLLGLSLLRQKKHSEAINEFQYALQLDSRFEAAKAHLEEARQAEGKVRN